MAIYSEFSPLSMVIFHSYVSLPEGKVMQNPSTCLNKNSTATTKGQQNKIKMLKTARKNWKIRKQELGKISKQNGPSFNKSSQKHPKKSPISRLGHLRGPARPLPRRFPQGAPAAGVQGRCHGRHHRQHGQLGGTAWWSRNGWGNRVVQMDGVFSPKKLQNGWEEIGLTKLGRKVGKWNKYLNWRTSFKVDWFWPAFESNGNHKKNFWPLLMVACANIIQSSPK